MAFYNKVKVFIFTGRLVYKDYILETGLSPALALKSACVGKNA